MHLVQGSRRAALELRRPALVFWTLAAGIVALDQATKAVIRARLAPGESVTLLDGIMNLTHVRNVGAAFGLLPGGRFLFIGTSLFVLLVVAAYWRRARPAEWPVVIALALVCSGALGNLIDRTLAGRVTDFFEFAFIEFPVWNVADAAIVVGVGILSAWLLFGPGPATQREPTASDDLYDTDVAPDIDVAGSHDEEHSSR